MNEHSLHPSGSGRPRRHCRSSPAGVAPLAYGRSDATEGGPMAIRWGLTIDCADPARLAEFWVLALGYEPAPPPSGFASWDEWYDRFGVPEDERGLDTIADPDGVGPRLWFQQVPEPKTVKNRLH